MTEAEWLVCEDPALMLEFLRDSASDRKLRLFACACCRRQWALLTDERSRNAVEVAERFVDWYALQEDLEAATRTAGYINRDSPCTLTGRVMSALELHLAGAFMGCCEEEAMDAVEVALWDIALGLGDVERPAHCQLVREIFGNPFRPASVELAWRAWNDDTVTKLACVVYEERAFGGDRMNVLADALEEAGCTDAQILTHLRGPGPHGRGCWAVDLVLAKA
jgi:hypothetical protein